MRKITDQHIIDAAIKFVRLRTQKLEVFHKRNQAIAILKEGSYVRMMA